MVEFASETLARMPLAEAVLLTYHWVADESFLSELYEGHRGRCHERVISFPLLAQLIADALLKYGGSGRQSFQRALDDQKLEASIQAAYGKLRRMPIEISQALLEDGTARLEELLPAAVGSPVPASLAEFRVVALDGKVIKRVAKRLKVLRKSRGGVLGGRALVAMSIDTGLAVALRAHPDGHANDVRFVPDLLPEVRGRIAGPILWLADRAFCGPEQFAQFTEAGGHVLTRYNQRNMFTPDADRPSCSGQDATGRKYVEDWGWMGRVDHPQRCYVRRITLERSGEEPLILVTDLLDGKRYPASDLLALYRGRWGIECMFQQVTEVFGLEELIGCSPEATIFQLAFCLLLYNVLQLVRAYVAAAQKRPRETISTEMLFVDVQRELTAWTVVVPMESTIAYLAAYSSLEAVRDRLHHLLDDQWSSLWLKCPTRKRKPRKKSKAAKGGRTHVSAHRLLQPQRYPPKGRPRRAR